MVERKDSVPEIVHNDTMSFFCRNKVREGGTDIHVCFYLVLNRLWRE